MSPKFIHPTPAAEALEQKQAPSLRFRFLLTGILLIGFIAGLAIKLVFDYSQKLADLSFDRLLQSALLQMDENVSFIHKEVLIDIPWSAFATLAQASDDRVFYKVESSQGGFITGYADIDSEPLYKPVMGKVQFFDRRYSGELVRFAYMERYLTDPEASGTVRIILGHTRLAREAMSNSITQRAVEVVVLVALVAITFIAVGSQLALRPLHRIGRLIEDRSPGDLSPLTLRTPKETLQLKLAINHFMARLQTNLEQLENYTADAAHQLRTPIASLKAVAENARDIQNPDAQRRALNQIVNQCEALNETVTTLLNQAVMSHRLQTQHKELLDLVEPVRDSCRDLAVTALRKGIYLSFECDLDGAMIVGDRFAIQQMMQNLIENAVRYSVAEMPSDDKVQQEVIVRILPGDGSFCVRVTDFGIGIPDAQKSRVFERFYRGRYDIAGTGVGLALVKDIADHHHACLEVLDTVPRGTTIAVSFPAYRGSEVEQ
ncbi:sensor histidine kinase [Maribrevibacterium harenarium]|uniref:histidine kinase n=1 Tax=Maribrevibacterium harenarium TaxID=2589817 RepID=A0A501WNW8_9GAMM|nr:sensor histidine kinase [Maribrevibacterium harenarium]TPE50542.1 sensor histidine kinase [Maribrevibacterium harenarium]